MTVLQATVNRQQQLYTTTNRQIQAKSFELDSKDAYQQFGRELKTGRYSTHCILQIKIWCDLNIKCRSTVVEETTLQTNETT